MSSIAGRTATGTRTKLNGQQIVGFWAAWAGWLLDGMDSVIYALVLAPALNELLPSSGYEATPANVGLAGSILFALFLVGWGMSFIWGPIADRFGRTRALAATILVYSLFTGLAAFSHSVYTLALFRLLAGVGVGGEWAMAGTYVAEAWPEDRRRMGAGYLQTGYYAGFFVAAGLNFTIGASYGWRAMFLCGLVPVLVSIVTLLRVREPARWERSHGGPGSAAARVSPLRQIFAPRYRQRTIVMSALLTVAIIGLWAGAVYEPTAIITLARQQGMSQTDAVRLVSLGTAILSIGTILGCLALPPIAERLGRRVTLGLYFLGMMATIAFGFGYAFYVPGGLSLFMASLFFLGFAGGNFAVFSLWLPELYGTEVRATAFAFATSVGRFIGAGVNFLLGALIKQVGTLGTPIAWTAAAFAIGILILPFATETRGQTLPD